jgi:uncharacterized protein (DUF362 family)
MKLNILNNTIDRRGFCKHLALSGLTILYGCSKDTVSPNANGNQNEPDPEPQPSSTTKVALYKTQNRSEGVQKVMEMLDFPSMSGKHVVVKPNFNTADPPPASTHNETLSQLISEIKDRGAAQVTLAERSYQNFNQVITQKSIDAMSNELGFAIKHLENDEYTIFNREDLHWQNGFRLAKTIQDADYIVSTCCLKTHHTGVITMSLKLGVGILPSLHMSELHSSSRINSMIAEINLAYKPNLIVMDGVKTFIAGGPSHGTEKDGNVIIAGTDRIAIDAGGTAILKDLGSTRVSGKIFELEQIKRAVELNLGIAAPNQIEFITADNTSSEYAKRLTDILCL